MGASGRDFPLHRTHLLPVLLPLTCPDMCEPLQAWLTGAVRGIIPAGMLYWLKHRTGHHCTPSMTSPVKPWSEDLSYNTTAT